MEVQFQRDGSENYLAVEGKEKQGYACSMLEHSHMEELLPFHIEYIDNKAIYFYEITSKQPLSVYLERRPVDKDFLVRLVERLVDTIHHLEEYLLDHNDLLLASDMIYINLKTNNCYFCYYPDSETSFEKEMQKLFQYLLERVDHRKREDAAFAYGLYQEICQEGFGMADLLMAAREGESKMQEAYEEIYQNKDGEKKNVKQIVKPEIPCEEIWQEKEVFVWEEDRWRYLSVFIGIFAVGAVGGWTLYRGFSGKSEWMVLASVFLLLICGIGFLQTWKKYKSSKLVSEPYRVLYEEEAVKARRGEWQENMDTVLLGYEEEEERYLAAGAAGLEDIVLSTLPFFIGKMKTQVDGVINKPSVSRVHAKIEEADGRYYLTDLNSTNGVIVDGKKLLPNEKVQIFSGCEIIFGEARYIFRYSPALQTDPAWRKTER